MNVPSADMHRHSGEICDGVRTSMFESEEEEEAGQAEAWKYTFAFAESLAVKSAVLLGIPDMIARRGPNATLSLSQIAAELPSEKPDVDCLFRLLRFLVAKNFFRADTGGGAVEVRYGLTPASKWMVKDGAGKPSLSMAAILLCHNDMTNVAAWHHLNESVLHGGVAFEKAHGLHIGDYVAAHPHYNHLFNQAWVCTSNIVMKAILSKYEGFRGLNSLVDVGGRTGSDVAEIVKAYPIIKAINYDLPHVIATAPHLSGVEHVGGDMFKGVPSADAVFMKVGGLNLFLPFECRRGFSEGLSQCFLSSYFFLEMLRWILHDWSNEDCIKILKQCREAIAKTGKVIIVDMVLNARGKTPLDPTLGFAYDLVKLACSPGGKERTEEQWKNVLNEAGFPRSNIIAIPTLMYVIEAFPY